MVNTAKGPFDVMQLRGLEFKNRIFVSPMCQYSAVDGDCNDWHLVHLGSRASGGASLVIAEATAVTPEGRISPGCLGLWNDRQGEKLARIVAFIKSQNAVAGIQIGHAGRKASTAVPWKGGKALDLQNGGWPVLGPSPLPFSPESPCPRELSLREMEELCRQFVLAAQRALRAGFEVLELHMAHGYLFHEFLSPLSNERKDEFGGTLANRMRFPLMAAQKVRAAWPDSLPLFVRISATDWHPGGWTIEDSIAFSGELQKLGVDFIDVSSGGNLAKAQIPVGPLYQVPFARAIREKVNIATGAVGMITRPAEAQEIIESGAADAVLLARALLRDPYWPLRAAKELGKELACPAQYGRAF